jgi:hypothetical protein
MCQIDIKELEKRIIEFGKPYNYTINYFRRNLNRRIQPSQVNHTSKIIRVPYTSFIFDLYGLAHEIAHIILYKTEHTINNEENAWYLAYEICYQAGVPMEEFEGVKDASLNGTDI